MPCYSPLKGFKCLETGGLTFRRKGTKETMEVSCGSCIGCRLDHSVMWASRIVHEAQTSLHFNNSFITLTYRDRDACTDEQYKNKYHVPYDPDAPEPSLTPSHVTKFIKRLRKSLPQKIKYFYCGEYGEQTGRPHYHMCVFNYYPKDTVIIRDKPHPLYTSPSLEKLWPYGFSSVGELNYKTAAYCAKYSTKKITGHLADEHYLRINDQGVAYWLLPQYIRMSTGRKRPSGLGSAYYEKYKTDFFPSGECPIPGYGVIHKIPRYYESICKEENPQDLELVKNIRKQFHKAHEEDYTPERQYDKYKVALARQTTRKL